MYHKHLRVLLAGTNINNLKNTDLSTLEFNLPTSNQEVTKITTFIAAVDTKIEQLNQKIVLLEQYKKGVMQKIFSQEIRFRADDGSEFPEWCETKLGEIGKFKSGIGFRESEQGGESGTPFFKVSDMNLQGNEWFLQSANNYVSEEQINRLRLKPIKKRAIVFAKVGAAIFMERKRQAQNFLIDNNMMAFVTDQNIDFLHQFLSTVHLSKFAQVGALPSYNSSDLSIIKIQLPSITEQAKIAALLAQVDSKIDSVAIQLKVAKTFKKGLLQQIFV